MHAMVHGIVAIVAIAGPGIDGQSVADSIRYRFEWLAREKPAVGVRLFVRGADASTTRFFVQPHWGGVQNCETHIAALVARSAGQTLPLRVSDDRPNVWIVEHEPGAELELTYELRAADKDPLETPGNHYRPIVRDDLFHLIGETGLIAPQAWEDDTEREFRFEWSGFAERGWRCASSFDATPPGQPIRTTLGRFRHGLFVAGKLRLHDRDIKGRTLRIALFGDDWGFADETFVDLAEKIVTAERDFFDDHDDPYYLISLIPAGTRRPGGWSFGGTGLTHSFALFMQPGPTLETGDHSTTMVARLLAHEYFHNWNGIRISAAQPEQLVYWFTEGFTDFYAARLLHRAGLIDDHQWVAWLNEGVANLWANPHRREKNDQIVAKFWTSREIGQLPYRRGEVVALLLDWEIRRKTGGARSLDHLIRELVKDDVARGQKLTTESLLERFARWTSDDFAARLRAIIVDGAMPEFPADFHAPALRHEIVEHPAFDLGFDADASVKAKEIVGVREGSPAYEAGLRNGQRVAGYSAHFGNANHPVEVTIKEDGGPRKVEYLPRGPGIETPRFYVNGPLRF